jgi:hypothetical protein
MHGELLPYPLSIIAAQYFDTEEPSSDSKSIQTHNCISQGTEEEQKNGKLREAKQKYGTCYSSSD